VSDTSDTLDGIRDAMAAALPGRTVQRSLVPDPTALDDAALTAGVVCLVTEGGGDFADYFGRRGELGKLQMSVVGFLRVADNAEPKDIEAAELQLLDELLAWCGSGELGPASDVTPQDWTQSKQIEHPYGWLILRLEVSL